MNNLQFYSEIKTYSVRQIISNSSDVFHKLFLPTIQRDFVWNEKRVKSFFSSIYRGFPIGIITLIKTSSEIPSYPFIGDIGREKGIDYYYVLDGQQRLTCLLALREGWIFTRRRSGNYPLIEIKVPHAKIDFHDIDNPIKRETGIDLRELLGSEETFRKLYNEVSDNIKPIIFSERERFLNYQIPFNIISIPEESSDKAFELLSEMFVNLNKQGVVISNVQIFLSFFLGKFSKGDIYEKIKINLLENYEKKYDLKPEPIIRLIHYIIGGRQFTFERFKNLINKYDIKDNLNKNLERISDAIEYTMSLLDDEIGLSKNIVKRFLPSQNSLIPLFYYVYKNKLKNISNDNKKAMIRYFILANLYSYFSGSVQYALNNDLDAITNSKDTNFPEELEFSATERDILGNYTEAEDAFDNITDSVRGRKNMLFLLYCLLYMNNADDWNNSNLKESEELEVQHIFPASYIEKLSNINNYYIQYNNLFNLTIISREKNRELSDSKPVDYIKNLSKQSLAKHFMPENFEIYNLDKDIHNYEKFIKYRRELIWQAFQKYIM
jgi:hypothetical protein